ncbi:MAG: 30S ribosomal protein S7 [Candidatus Diapherotrites archaeon]|nr:30S ribosomal protein S7 [Candidatus Diapherotrites archaeon]
MPKKKTTKEKSSKKTAHEKVEKKKNKSAKIEKGTPKKPEKKPAATGDATKKEKSPEDKKTSQKKAPAIHGYKVFGKWELGDIVVTDPGLKGYINLKPLLTFHTFGRHASSTIDRNRISIIERVINAIMRSGTRKKIGGKRITARKGCGKKDQAYKATKEAFDEIHKKTKDNPIQVLVRAIENSAPREETTRVKFGGITKHIAVDISPQRRINFALRNLALGALVRAYKSKKSRGQALAEELIAAANSETTSLAIARKNEVERVARGAR